MRVNTQIVGFKKIKFYTLENVGAGHLSMPEQEMHTTAFWLHFPAAFPGAISVIFTPRERQSGMTALGNALRSVASLLLMCDPHDLGVAMTEKVAPADGIFEPNLYLYDTYPGGIGQSSPLFRLSRKLFSRLFSSSRAARVDTGVPVVWVPSVKSAKKGKEAAVRFLEALCGPPVTS